MATSEPKILWDKAPISKLNQIYNNGPAFCLLAPTLEGLAPIMPLVFCKDYLHDVIWASLNSQEINVHGLYYNPATALPVFREKTLLGVRNESIKSEGEAEQLRTQTEDLLRQVEKVLGLEPTAITPVEGNTPLAWLVEGDARWMLASPLISFYSLLIRSGGWHTIGMGAQESLDQMLRKQDEYSTKLQALFNEQTTAVILKRREIAARIEELKTREGELSSRGGHHIKLAQAGIREILENGVGLFSNQIEENYPPDILVRLGGPAYITYLHNFFGLIGFSTQSYYRKHLPVYTSGLGKETV